MALKVQASFAAGELDPALHERTTFQKYQSGLMTGRSVCVGKTGRLLSRPSRKYSLQCKIQNRKVIIHPRSMTSTYLEWGHLYVRVYQMDGTLLFEDTHTLTEADLPYIDFVDVDAFNTLVFLFGREVLIVNYSDEQIFAGTTPNLFNPGLAVLDDGSTIGGTGYDVEYYATAVKDRQELSGGAIVIASAKIPVDATEQNIIIVNFLATEFDRVSEVRIYRRPDGGGAFGFIGSTTVVIDDGGAAQATFTDFGQDADYLHNPPQILGEFGEFINGDLPGSEFSSSMLEDSGCGVMFKQRLLMASGGIICASRVGKPFNFNRDFPLSSDGALSFKSQTSAPERIYRMLVNEFLAVFSSEGIFVHEGSLSPDNLDLPKKGPWVIDPRTKPLAIPGGVVFVDSETNSIRSLSFSTEANSFIADEVSVFSDHLFINKRVTSWAFQSGEMPLLWVTFSDRTYASFTYDPQQEMRAWTRHDSGVGIEYVASTKKSLIVDFDTPADSVLAEGQVIFVCVDEDGYRHIELGVPRYVSSENIDTNPEADMGPEIANMDSMVSWSSLISDSLAVGDQINVSPVTADDWVGNLWVGCNASNLFTSGDVGEIFRFFHPVEKWSVDLEVMEYVDQKKVICRPSRAFPFEYAEDIRLYETASVFNGLDHMEGEYVSIVSDGNVVASPNNDVDNFPFVMVESGAITLPKSKRGAIVHIGRPITNDIETLDIDSVEQRPVLLESQTVNKVYIKVHKTRGLFVGNKFPDDDKVEGMEKLLPRSIDYEDEEEVIPNRYSVPKTERIEQTIRGDWKSNGRICLRNVDPIHFEILSIIPDVDDQRR